jgi:hypothetical protein
MGMRWRVIKSATPRMEAYDSSGIINYQRLLYIMITILNLMLYGWYGIKSYHSNHRRQTPFPTIQDGGFLSIRQKAQLARDAVHPPLSPFD